MVEEGSAGLVGERVVGEINPACGASTACRSCPGDALPEPGTVLGIVGRDGAFVEYLVLPEENLHRVPKEIDTDAATFVEPLAAALAIQHQVTIRPDERFFYSVTASWGNLSRRPWP